MIRNRKRIKLRYAGIYLEMRFYKAIMISLKKIGFNFRPIDIKLKPIEGLESGKINLVFAERIKPVSTHDSGTLYEND